MLRRMDLEEERRNKAEEKVHEAAEAAQKAAEAARTRDPFDLSTAFKHRRCWQCSLGRFWR